MLECFLGIGCINIKAKVNETMLNATETKSFNMYIITEMLLGDELPTVHTCIGTCVHD